MGRGVTSKRPSSRVPHPTKIESGFGPDLKGMWPMCSIIGIPLFYRILAQKTKQNKNQNKKQISKWGKAVSRARKTVFSWLMGVLQINSSFIEWITLRRNYFKVP